MKKQFKFKSLLLAVIASMLMGVTSCKKDEDPKPEPPVVVSELKGDITSDLSISGNIKLIGKVHVKPGVTLNIAAGTKITANADELSYLLIEQGAKIMAEGTASKPIIMTSTLEESGAWGGVHICGKAPINSGATGLSEIGNALYGGNDKTDNSGLMKYVRIEYSGTALDDEHEANGISFYGVGNGTTIDYIEVYIGSDDGIEFFGGTVNIKHVKVESCKDDSFDWVEGWQGKGQFLIAVQGEVGDRGFEGDNLKADNTATPKSSPTFSNVTLIGAGDAENYGMKLRRGTAGIFKNIILAGGFDKRSIHIENSETLRNLVDGSLLIDYAYINNQVSDVAIKYSEDDGDAVNIEGHKVEDSENVFLQDLTTAVSESTTYTGGFDMSTDDSFFESTNYIGAGSEWLSGWTR